MNFGSELSPADAFNQQISVFETQVAATLNGQAIVAGQRTTAIFQYITGWRTQFQQAVSNMTGQAFTDNNVDGNQLLQAYVKLVQMGIPMADVNGVVAQGWQNNFQIKFG